MAHQSHFDRILRCTVLSASGLLASVSHVTDAAGEGRTVYKCIAQGLTTFSDTPCSSTAQVYEADTSRISTYTPVEHAATAASASVARKSAAPKARANGSIAADQARHAVECERLNNSLHDIRSKMRAGYNAREGERLRERQTKIEQKRRGAACH